MYYNQNNYPHIPYPAPGYEKATVKSGGCGTASGSTGNVNLGGEHTHPITFTAAEVGGGEPHENRPPYCALYYIMKE